MIIDTHCHIQFRGYDADRAEVIKRCREKNIIMNAVGTQIDTSRAAVELAEKNPDIYATIGLHPIHLFSTHVDEEESSFLSREENFDFDAYKKLGQSEKVIAVGECGLELFHVPPTADRAAILARQKETFLLQVKLAQELNVPLVIHVRDAYDEMLELLLSLRGSAGGRGRENPNEIASPSARNDISGVVHCYSGNWRQAQGFLGLGLYLGFTGVITFPARKTNPQPTIDLLEVVKNAPLDRILVETDSPYLAPQAYRGQRCEPWMTIENLRKIAEIKGLDLAEVSEAVLNNTKKLFTKIKV